MASFSFELGDGKTMPGVGIGTFQVAASDAESLVATALQVRSSDCRTIPAQHDESH